MIKRLVIAAALLTVTPAAAAPIEYVFSGLLSGTLGGNAFVLAPVSFSLISDTDLVFQPVPSDPDLFNTPATTLNFVIAGTAGRFDSQFNAFSNVVAGNGLVGFSEAGSSDIFDVSDPGLVNYDLRSPIGPVSDSPVDFLNFGTLFTTTVGDLVFDDDDDASLSFQARAVAAAVPEPATWALMTAGFGLVGVGVRRRGRSITGFA